MDIQEVEVTIDKNGKVSLQVRGVKGNQCLALTKDLEQALGGEVETREMTAEALEVIEEQNQEKRRLQGSA